MKVILCLVICASCLHSQIERWVYTYNGQANSSDCANAIIYGDDGNIYAAGYTTGSGTSKDFTIISVSPNGEERWVYSYNGAGNSADEAHSIVYGTDGNLYATGYSYESNGNRDFTVICVTSSGNQRWVYTYNGPGNGNDEAYSIVYGVDDNLYIAGKTYYPGTADEFTVISLDTAGTERWIYIGPSTTDPDNDYARSIIYGADSHVYATGKTTAIILGAHYGIYRIVSLDTDGNAEWEGGRWYGGVLYASANAVTYGLDDTLYTAGAVGRSGNPDIGIVAFDTSGAWLWEEWYNGSDNGSDEGFAIVRGSPGAAYATGFSIGSGTGRDITVIGHGETDWVYTFNHAGSYNDESYSIVFGLNNTLYVAGWSRRSNSTGDDFTVISLDTTGVERWVYAYNRDNLGTNKAYDIVYGLDNNLYAAGCTYDINQTDFAIISLDTTTTYIAENTNHTVPFGEILITPNPFRVHTDIRLPIADDRTQIRIYDVIGKLVKSLSVPSTYSLVPTAITWHGDDEQGRSVAQGVYFIKIKRENHSQTEKVVVVR